MRLIEKSNTLKLFESLNSANSATDLKFKETVLRDFKNFIEDKYDIKNFNELSRKLKNLSEKDIDDYFTGMFYEIADTGDTESAGLAREIIIDEFGVLDTYSDDYEYDDGDTNWAAEEEADALERFENRYMGGGNGASFNESSKFLNEASDSSIDSIVNDVLSGNEVYVRLDEKDYSSEEGSNIYKIEYSYSIERPEDYDNGYNSGWDRGQDEEFDKKQDERFEKATKAYEEGEVFEFNCVKIEDGKIQYTGFCLLKCFGIEELRYNLEYYKAKRIGVKTISSFEDLTEGVNKFTESANDRYQVREFDGPGAKFGVYDTKQKKFIQKGSKKVMAASCDGLNKKSKSSGDRYQVREFDGPGAKFGVYDTKQKKFIQKGSKKVVIAGCDELNKKAKLTERVKVKESVKPLNEGGIYPVEVDEEANQALANKLAEILGCDSGEYISVDGLELIPAKGFGGGGHYWFRAQVNIGQAGSYHEDFIWRALEAVKDLCPHLYKVYENGTQSGPGSIVTGETSGLEVNYYSTIDIIDDEDVRNGLSFEYSDEDLELAGCDLKTLEAEETPVGDYLCNLVKEHMSELIELLKSYEISEDDYEEADDLEEYNESVKPKKEKKDKRVIMQQGNVTCFKEDEDIFYVFENEHDNEVEYNNENDAMQDFMERVGIDTSKELKED